MNFHVVNLGCKVNRAEADALSAALLADGWTRAPLALADLIVVNTCTVTGEADKKARKAVRHALSSNSSARVTVTGCASAINSTEFSAMDPRVDVVERAELFVKLADGVNRPLLRTGEGFRTRLNLKVQDGCDHACTYCIVHVARGPASSVPALDVLEEARYHLEHGVGEIVLTGIDLGSYRSGAMRLSGLVSELLEAADKARGANGQAARIRASSLEPDSIDDDFIDLLAKSDGRLCRHVHLPLQSGSSRILSEMHRCYSAEQYLDLVNRLYERIPTLSITTDIIVGFPGETDEDFAQTVAMAEACRFSKIHVFPYSRREGTPAAARTDQVDAAVKEARAAELRDLSDRLRRLDLERRTGLTELVLVEDTRALTESYHEVPVPEGAAPGELVRVRMGS